MEHKKAVAGATVASLAAAGLVAIWRHREGKKLRPEDHDAVADLHEAAKEGSNHPLGTQLRTILVRLEQRGVATAHTVVDHLGQLRAGRLSDETTIHVESVTEEIAMEARQRDV